MQNFEIFVIFGVNLRHFHLEKCNKLFENEKWTTNYFTAKMWQKMREHI